MVRSHTERFRKAAEQKGLSIAVIAGTSGLRATVDRRGLELILDKVVGNAIKFTEKGRVTVFVESDERSIHVAVRDTGIGICRTFLPRLFEAFWQESDGLARTHEGSGLGLAIAARLAERMNGSIRVQSEKGHGSTFVFTFPLDSNVHSDASKPSASHVGALLGVRQSWQPREHELARPLIGLSHGDGAAGYPSLEPVIANPR
jgi:signal transduction histidine kinase